MFKSEDISDYIIDIANAISEVAEFIDGMTFETFSGDKKTINAVIRSLEVIGEAAKHVPEDFRKQYPEIPWSQMAGMRDVLIHDYMGVDLRTVWKVATERLPELSQMVESIKRSLE